MLSDCARIPNREDADGWLLPWCTRRRVGQRFWCCDVCKAWVCRNLILLQSHPTAPFNDLPWSRNTYNLRSCGDFRSSLKYGPHYPSRYLSGLSSLCKEYGALLVVDEVMTGFRLARGGACERLKIDADLVTLGKIVGGGLPLAAFGGRRDVMECLSPLGSVYQAGTLSGNPLAVAAGRAGAARVSEHAAAAVAAGYAARDTSKRREYDYWDAELDR